MFWLTRYIGSGKDTHTDPLRPLGADELGVYSSLDFRPDSSVVDGFALLQGAGPLPAAAGRVSLGDDPDAVSPAVKSAIESRLGITLADNRLRRIVRSLLVEHARTDGTRWKPLQSEVDGWYRIWFGGLFDFIPRVAGGAFTESFNKADSVTLGPDLTWTELVGNIDVVSNQARSTTVGSQTLARADADLVTTNHYAQAIIGASEETQVAAPGLIVRKDSTTTQTFYLANPDFNANEAGLFKCVAGSFTLLAQGAVTLTAGSTYLCRLETNGSTQRILVDGTQIVSLTDTAVTTGVRTGLRGAKLGSGYTSWDSFQAGDIGVALPFVPPRIRRALMRSA